MDFVKSVETHVKWKAKLAAYIANPDHSLDAAAIAKDNNCELGKWLHQEKQKHAQSPTFAKLIVDHARFHQAAADVITKADSGKRMAEEVTLGAKSEYAAASNAVVSDLMKMKREAA